MGRIPIKTTLTDAGAGNELQDLVRRLRDPQGFYKLVGERFLSGARDRFRTQTAPRGTAWRPLKARTIKAREKRGQTPITILRSNSRGKAASSLAGSLSYEAGGDAVTIGSPLAYAAIHQFGGTINKPARTAQIFRKRDAQGQIGRRFVKRDRADVVTTVTIPAHKIHIPARQFLGLTAGDEIGILEDARAWLWR